MEVLLGILRLADELGQIRLELARYVVVQVHHVTRFVTFLQDTSALFVILGRFRVLNGTGCDFGMVNYRPPRKDQQAYQRKAQWPVATDGPNPECDSYRLLRGISAPVSCPT
jgi:hypothetical protein